jgi:hypothetical protein
LPPDMRIFIGLIVCVLAQPVFAQFSKSYKPIAVLDSIPVEIHNRMKDRLKQDEAAIQEPKAKASSYMKSLYKGRFDYLVQTFNDDKFLVDSELNQYLTEILQTILQANPELPRDVSVYVYRSSIPNAVCYGEGTLAIALSLLARLENEDQVAFVLCHELAHHYKKHPDQKVKDLTRLNFDKELNKQVKEIKNSSYGQYTKLKDLAKGMELSLNRHGREHEFEADSIGLQLFLKTSYHVVAPVRTMEILDSVDRTMYPAQFDIKKYFGWKDYAYKASWAEYTKSDTWFAKKEVADSAKTHPSCQLRASALTRQLARTSKWPTNIPLKNDEVFNFIRTTSEFELVESEYHFKEYGKALFRSLMMLEQFPDNAYLHGMVGKCLYNLYENQKNHTIGKVLELPDPRFDENYDRFLTFIHRLRLSELENLAYYYLTTKKEEYFSDENFLYSVWLCSRLSVSKLDPESVKEDYLDKFPKGRYLKK